MKVKITSRNEIAGTLGPIDLTIIRTPLNKMGHSGGGITVSDDGVVVHPINISKTHLADHFGAEISLRAGTYAPVILPPGGRSEEEVEEILADGFNLNPENYQDDARKLIDVFLKAKGVKVW